MPARVLSLLTAIATLAATGVWAVSIRNHAESAVHAASQPLHTTRRTDRTYLTHDQVAEAYSAGLIDRPIRSILNVSHPLSYGEFIWDEDGVPAGPVWVRVDLTSQLISVFRAGDEIGTALVLYGAQDKETPRGLFPVLAMEKDHRSSTYGEAPMPYTLRLTGDGVSIHGSAVRWGYATHGCIGVPVQFARNLFREIHKGDQVLILATRGQIEPDGASART